MLWAQPPSRMLSSAPVSPLQPLHHPQHCSSSQSPESRGPQAEQRGMGAQPWLRKARSALAALLVEPSKPQCHGGEAVILLGMGLWC